MTFTLAFRFSPAARRYARSTSAASRRDAKRAKFRYKVLKSLALKVYLRAWLEISDLGRPSPHPISFPPGPHIPRKLQEKRGKKFFVAFFSIFYPSKLQSKFCIEKMTKKMRKSRILAFQNPPKTLPKSFQNRCPKKHRIFTAF